MSNKMITFLQEVRTELSKVTWPKRDELVGSVVVVCFLALVFAFLIGFMDAGIHFVIRWLIR